MMRKGEAVFMRLSEVLKEVEVISANVDLNTEISDICYDSRKADRGAAFVAISGFKTDGNAFIHDALDRGAAVVITENAQDGIPCVVVKNCRRALAQMSAAWFGYPSEKFKLIGITGTNGKTTTSYWIKEIIDKITGKKTGLIGTNQILIADKELPSERTTPESFELQKLFAQMADSGCEYVVMEVSSHSLELDRVYGADFDIGVFTNLTQDHLDFHGTMENYRNAKAKLFDMCRVGVFNLDDQAGRYYVQNAKCQKVTYGIEHDDGSVTAKNIRYGAAGVAYEALINEGIARINISTPGIFSVYNSLAAAAAALCMGFNIYDIAEALKQAKGVRGRAEVVANGEYTVLVDYAHTPDGVQNILTAAKGFTEGRIICVFGCGGDRDKTKRPIMGRIAAELSDIPIVTSDNPRTEDPSEIIKDILAGIDKKKYNPIVIENRAEAITEALKQAKKGDTVLLLGKGHETYQEINGHKAHFDDREQALRAIGALANNCK